MATTGGFVFHGKCGDRPFELDSFPYWYPGRDPNYEDPEKYCKGGFCPIVLYQTLKNDRYRVVYKLGIGVSATVWLAQDLEKDRYVAIKILTAESSEHSLETIALRRASEPSATSQSPNNLSYVVSLLDSFDIVSANGKHCAVVMPPTCNAYGMVEGVSFPSFCKSLVLGLGRLHSANICHGDIHANNVSCLFTLEDVTRIMCPECHPLPPVGEHFPSYVVSDEEWSGGFTKDEGDVKGTFYPLLQDLGGAFFVSNDKPFGGDPAAIPRAYRPPEMCFSNDLLSKRSDIWALGATLFELGAGGVLISGREDAEVQMLRIDDRLAPGWQADPQHLKLVANGRSFTERLIKFLRRDWMDYGNEDLIEDFFRGMLATDPDRRLSWQELLEHPYIADVLPCGVNV